MNIIKIKINECKIQLFVEKNPTIKLLINSFHCNLFCFIRKYV